jgi:MATE family multidrug resistance protein
MVANLTTPLIGIVSTIAIGRLGDATLLGGVAIASVIFDCLFWLFGFLRMSTLAFTAQALGAGEAQELRAQLVRGLVIAAALGAALIVLQLPLAAMLFGLMGGSEGVKRAANIYFTIRIWSAPLVLANYVVLGWLIGQARARLALSVQIAINLINMAATVLLVLVYDAGIAGAAIAAVVAEAIGLVLGVLIARRLSRGMPAIPRAALLDRTKLLRMLAVNRITIRGIPDRRVPVLHRAGRARRRRDASRQRGSQQLPADQRVLSRRPRQRRRATLRPRLWRARPHRIFERDPARDIMGLRLCAGGDRVLRAVRSG